MGILDTATKPLRPGAGQAARTGAWAAGRGAGVLRSVTRQGEDETPGEGLDRGHSVQPGKVDKAGKAEKAPERLAKEGKGRQTAPLGSKGTANGETKGGGTNATTSTAPVLRLVAPNGNGNGSGA